MTSLKRSAGHLEGEASSLPVAKRTSDAHHRLTGPPAVIWAEKRQSLCDSLPYYKSYQKAVYATGGVCYGFLIDQEADDRDIFGAQVIITTAGGGRIRDEDGETIRVEDQKMNSDLKSIIKAFTEKTSVVIIAGSRHPSWPAQEPEHRYSVLGTFHVAAYWAEKRNTCPELQPMLTYVLRFERTDLQEISWWYPEPNWLDPKGYSSADAVKVQSFECTLCHKESPACYEDTDGNERWACLNEACEDFFKFQVDHFTLRYSNAFLKQRTTFAGTLSHELPTTLPLTDTDGMKEMGKYGTESEYRRGFVCPQCNCCNTRVLWTEWRCSNEACDFVLPGNMQPIPWEIFNKETSKHRGGTKNPNNVAFNKDVIRSYNVNIGRRTASVLLLPDTQGRIIGSVTIIPADDQFCARANGANDIFRALETVDTGNKRNAVMHEGHASEMLTQSFSQNYGAFYKYGVKTQSKSFKDAPDAILMAMQYLIWAGDQAVAATATAMAELRLSRRHGDAPPSGDVKFNELLHLSYMQLSCIKPHDDGERELGPTVAAFSVGSPAHMIFRPKWKENFPNAVRNKSHYKPVLSFNLFHGDLVVMHGAAIHRLYEHGVDSLGLRRFVLTARTIKMEALTEENAEKAEHDGFIPERAQQWAYDGQDD